MITLSNLAPNTASTKPKKRVGRGHGAGHGKTACRGHKGAKARSGSSLRPGFEGGQMPLQRRVPKGGFTNISRKEYSVVNIQDLEGFTEGTTIDKNTLLGAGIIKKKNLPVKILGKGNLTKKFTIDVDSLSKSAHEKIIAAGGNIKE